MKTTHRRVGTKALLVVVALCVEAACGVSAQAQSEGAPQALRAAMGPVRAQAGRCYEETLRAHPEAQGRVLVEFVLDGEGRVRSAQATEAPSVLASVASCVVEAVRGVTFAVPPGSGTLTVRYPFDFRP